jgi:hypothetical protein
VQGSKGGQGPAFAQERSTRRNAIERCFARLKQHHAIATRFDETAASFKATMTLPASSSEIEDTIAATSQSSPGADAPEPQKHARIP